MSTGNFLCWHCEEGMWAKDHACVDELIVGLKTVAKRLSVDPNPDQELVAYVQAILAKDRP